MWKRNEEEDQPVRTTDASPTQVSSRPAPPRVTAPSTAPSSGVANIGRSVVVKGELVGSEDLVIDGRVEGTINLRQHLLTIGPDGRITAEVTAKSVVVLGQVEGNIAATEKIEIRENGTVDGDISAPRVAIAEGAHFRGSIDMQQSSGKETIDSTASAKRGGATSGAARVAASSAAPPLPRK